MSQKTRAGKSRYAGSTPQELQAAYEKLCSESPRTPSWEREMRELRGEIEHRIGADLWDKDLIDSTAKSLAAQAHERWDIPKPPDLPLRRESVAEMTDHELQKKQLEFQQRVTLLNSRRPFTDDWVLQGRLDDLRSKTRTALQLIEDQMRWRGVQPADVVNASGPSVAKRSKYSKQVAARRAIVKNTMGEDVLNVCKQLDFESIAVPRAVAKRGYGTWADGYLKDQHSRQVIHTRISTDRKLIKDGK